MPNGPPSPPSNMMYKMRYIRAGRHSLKTKRERTDGRVVTLKGIDLVQVGGRVRRGWGRGDMDWRYRLLASMRAHLQEGAFYRVSSSSCFELIFSLSLFHVNLSFILYFFPLILREALSPSSPRCTCVRIYFRLRKILSLNKVGVWIVLFIWIPFVLLLTEMRGRFANFQRGIYNSSRARVTALFLSLPRRLLGKVVRTKRGVSCKFKWEFFEIE